MRHISVVLLDRRMKRVDLDCCLPVAPGTARVSLPYANALNLLSRWLAWQYKPIPGEWPPPSISYHPLIGEVFETPDHKVIVATRRDMLKKIAHWEYWEVHPEFAEEWCRVAGVERTTASPDPLLGQRAALAASADETVAMVGRRPVQGEPIPLPPETPEEREEAVAKWLIAKPRMTSGKIFGKTGIPEGTVRKTDAWKNRPSWPKKLKPQKTDASYHSIPLTAEILAVRPAKSYGPATVVEEGETEGWNDDPEQIRRRES